MSTALTIFGAGLLLLAAAGVRLLVLIRRPGSIPARTALIGTGVALIGYLPQFFGPIELRIAHGLLLALGLVLLAVADHTRGTSSTSRLPQAPATPRYVEVTHLPTLGKPA